MTVDQAQVDSFTAFFRRLEPQVRRGLVATLGFQIGQEAAAAAMVYAWQHWDRVRVMENPAGYLYRVGCHSRPRRRLPRPLFPEVDEGRWPWVEPALPRALQRLSEHQRTVVILLHCFQWTHAEVADLLGIARGSVQEHEQRALRRLRRALGVTP